MANDAPRPTETEYLLTVCQELGFGDDSSKAESSYRINMRSALGSITAGPELGHVVDALKAAPQSYLGGNRDLLFYPAEMAPDLRLQTKSFSGVVNKLYRHNIIFNRSYPAPPKGGFWSGPELYTAVDDLIRTRLVCRYMDGPRFICEFLAGACEERGIDQTYRELSNEAGYYAWHFYFKVPVELSIGNGIEARMLWVELQFTTQLAELITALTHDLYEKRREGTTPELFWKWDPTSPHFRSAFIGHGLHLLEGVIVSYRDDVLKEIDGKRSNGETTPPPVEEPKHG